MKTTLTITGAAVAVALSLASPIVAVAQSQAAQPTNNCPGDQIDNSTAAGAQKKMEAAGYTDVSGLNKGCDNVWHAAARANGNPVNVMVGPDGVVRQEGS